MGLGSLVPWEPDTTDDDDKVAFQDLPRLRLSAVTQRCGVLSEPSIVHLMQMVVNRVADRNSVLRQYFVLCACFFASLLTTGCKNRTNDVVGIWEWGKYTVHFDADQTWGALDKKSPTVEKLGGSWSVSGNDVSLGYVGGGNPLGKDAVFTISDDGQQLVASTGSTGVMVKKKLSDD